MNASVTITVGTFATELAATETGPDGLHDLVDQARSIVREFVGEQACHAAAVSVWVEG